MQNSRARVLAAAFAAALCTVLSACSGSGTPGAIPQPSTQNAQSPSQPAQAPSQSGASSEHLIVDSTSVTAAKTSYTYSNFQYHITPVHGTTASSTSKGTRHAATTTYPMDLSYFGGPVASNVTTHNIYLDCSKIHSCWGEPYKFLSDLGKSSMLQLIDQYNGPVSLTPGPSVQETHTLYSSTLYDDDLLRYIHRAIYLLGGNTPGAEVYNLFLPPGVDTCFDQTSTCYSPDNPSNFAFCAYHGAVQYSDYGIVLFTVEPYQGVNGCDFGNSSDLVSAGANVLSHETFETMTDPLPGYGWVNQWGYGEIGDECAWSSLTPETMNGDTYNIQLEYSNAVHACSDQSTAPTSATIHTF
jgi:hypothetical protein